MRTEFPTSRVSPIVAVLANKQRPGAKRIYGSQPAQELQQRRVDLGRSLLLNPVPDIFDKPDEP
jgi:hypothetical protein